MEPVYQFREGFRVNLPASVVGETIERLKGESGGEVTPAQVVEAARPEAAPLHPALEWRDPVAAELYREHQARYIIRSYSISFRDDGREVGRSIVANVRVVKDDRSVYVSSVEAQRDEDLRAQMLDDAGRLVAGARDRLHALQGLGALVAELDRVRQRLDAARAAAARPKRRKGRPEPQPV